MILSKYLNPFDLFPSSEFSDRQDYIDYVSNLPRSIRNLLVSDSTGEFINTKIKPAYNLNEQQVEAVTSIIRDILLATLMLKDMVEALKKEVPMQEDKAKELANTIVGQIFPPAINDIKEIHRAAIGSPTIQNPQIKQPPDPVTSSQRIGGTLDLRQSPANIPSVAPKPAPSPVQTPVQSTPSTQPSQPKPTQQPFQPTYTPPKPPQPIPPRPTVLAPQAPRPIAPQQAQPPVPRPPTPPSAPVQPQQPRPLQPPAPTQPKVFKMPPPLDGSLPTQPKPPVFAPPKSEPQHNINADKVIDLRDLEKK